MQKALFGVGKAQMALMRRLPFDIKQSYIIGLNTTIQCPAQASSAYHEIFIREIYKPIRMLPPSPTVVDLGANLGLFALYASKILLAGHVYSFEASPLIEKNLRKNLSSISANVTLTMVAITDAAGHLSFYVDSGNSSSLEATAFRDVTSYARPESFRKIDVPCAPLSDFITSKIDFLKCDIEGGEYTALQPWLFSPDKLSQAAIEFHDIDAHADDLRRIKRLIEDNDYVCFDDKGVQLARNWDELFLSRHASGILKLCHASLLAKS